MADDDSFVAWLLPLGPAAHHGAVRMAVGPPRSLVAPESVDPGRAAELSWRSGARDEDEEPLQYCEWFMRDVPSPCLGRSGTD